VTNSGTQGTGTRSYARDPGSLLITPATPPGARADQWIDVRAYSAAGDGAADDTLAVQQALDQAGSAGLACYLPTGTYLVSGLRLPAGCPALFGDGNDLSILKRIGAAADNAPIIQVFSLSDFSVSHIGLDGNKAAQSLGANNIQVTGCFDFVLRGLRSFGAKAASGYGAGFVLRLLPTTSPNGREAAVLGCEAYDNDSTGLAIQQTGAAITIDGGVYSDNGGDGINYYDQAVTQAEGTVPNMAIRAVRAERNAGSGITVAGFIVSGLAGVRTYGHGSDPVKGAVIANCSANDNGGYGIFCQATGATIAGNACAGNGTTFEAGICANAQRTTITGNAIICGAGAFGIDAGGLKDGVVQGNTVEGDVEIGINLGAAEHVVCADNVIEEARTAIYVPLNDAGAYWFPWDTTDVTIARNKIRNKNSDPNRYGILVTGQPLHIHIEGNVFDWVAGDTAGYNCILAAITAGRIVGNRLLNSTTGGWTVNAAASITIPEWADLLNINTDTAAITAILSRSQQTYLEKVSAVKMTDRGSGYTADFAVIFSGGGGSGAAATARVTQDGRVACIQVTSAGTGYTSAPTVDLSNGAGTGAAATAMVGLSTLWGRQVDLFGFLSNFRIQSNASLLLPAPLGTVLAIGSNGGIRITGAAGLWYCGSYASGGDGNLWTTTLAYPDGRIDASGSGSPEGVLAAPVGSTYRRTDGGTGTSFYVKESGTGNTGWAAK
jgi:hypothetical protein